MIDQEIKYALKGKRGAGSEMERRLAERVDINAKHLADGIMEILNLATPEDGGGR